MIQRRKKKPGGTAATSLRDASRRAALQQLVADHRAESGTSELLDKARRSGSRRIASTTEPAPGARIYRVTLVTPGSENESIQVEAINVQEAKRHATSAFMSTPGAIGLMVREVGGHAEAES